MYYIHVCICPNVITCIIHVALLVYFMYTYTYDDKHISTYSGAHYAPSLKINHI